MIVIFIIIIIIIIVIVINILIQGLEKGLLRPDSDVKVATHGISPCQLYMLLGTRRETGACFVQLIKLLICIP